MARYEESERETLRLIAGSLDDLLAVDSVARSILAGISRLDFSAFDELYGNDAVGRPAIDPRSLASVWTLALLRGVTSSVRLASLCERDLEFRWLLGDVRVEKSTLCDFRKHHQAALVSLSAQVLQALGQHQLLPGKNMGVDGTIVQAAASRHASKSRRSLEKDRQRLQALLEQRLSQGDADAESGELRALNQRRVRTEQALAELDKRNKMDCEAKLTVTEPDAGVKKLKNHSFAPAYNVQAVTDLDTGVIVSVSVVDSGNDCGQLQPQVEQAQAALDALGQGEGRLESITADSAYHDTRQLHELEGRNLRCYVADDGNKNRQAPNVAAEYQAECFAYEEATDSLKCPMGKELKRRKPNKNQTAMTYQAPTQTCQNCPAKSQCCPNATAGRCVNRTLPVYQETLDRVEQRLHTEEGKRKLHARWVTCEGVYARFNDLLHWKRCRMWNRVGAEMEVLWRQFIHNFMLLIEAWKPLVHANA